MTAKDLAYGKSQTIVHNTNMEIFRLQRGFPYKRRGKYVAAVPQFKTQTIFSPTNQTVIVGFGNPVTPTQTKIPVSH